MGRARNEQGHYSDRIPPADVLEVFEEREDRARPLTANDVTDALGIARRTAHNKLNALVERGELETRKVGARGRVWWVPITRDEAAASSDTQSRETVDAPADPSPVAPEEPSREPAESGLDVDAAIDAVDTPGSGETQERRREALREMYDYLREHGTARRRDFEEIVDAEDVGYGSFNSFWNNYVKAKDALKQLPNVDPPGEGEHTWRYSP